MSDLTYRQNPRTAGRVIDGLAFVVTPDDNKLHSLNATATYIWQLTETGRTVAEVAASLANRFDVDPDRARGDVARFCEDLRARGILEVVA